jgi:tetratricopeptide (TPR) repeat protein
VRAVSAALLGLALACLWDSDTLAEEALRQKDVGDVVRGRITKHSTFFYEEKVRYTKPLVDAGKAPAERYDDLAVAYDHLGQYDEAIAVMRAKDERFPGLYTTLANQGTFEAHRGNFAAALELLKAALVKNPDAHFGREQYQVKAIEYLEQLAKTPELERHRDLLGVDLSDADGHDLLFGDLGRPPKKGEKTGLERAGLKPDVLVGLAGIIRFGHGEKSRHLWLSLGVACALHGDRHLAIRAFARAHALGHPRGEPLAQRMAMTLKDFDGKLDLERLAKEFEAGQAEVAKAQAAEDAKLKAGKQRQVFGY